jgi:ribonuclease T2
MALPRIRDRVAIAAFLAAALFAATPASGRDRPGDFDFYVLALSVAPSFCELTGYRTRKAQCQNPADTDYRDTPLTIHGLWPNKRHTPVRDQPQSCSNEQLPHLSDDLAGELRKYMPGVADGLHRYEWSKHGVCSGLSADAYFRRIVALAQAANDTIGTVMKEKGLLGKPVAITALIDAVAAKNPDLADALQVDCQFARRGQGGGPSRAYVREIRVLVAKDASPTGTGGWPATFVPRASVGYGVNSGCPGGVGFLPGGFAD